jgi:pyruvate/2-oxoglutarate dehydrogenase complex dihydrolipoamide acyltransferase (E2) component
MTTPVILPSLGAGVKDVTVLRWLKAVGEPIVRGETLLEVETDKIATEICAERDGTLLEIGPAVGDRVPTGAVLAVIGEASGVRRQASDGSDQVSAVGHQPSAISHQQSQIANYRGPISPVVSRLITEHGLDINVIPGTGQDGRVTKHDVLAYLERRMSDAVAGPESSPMTIATDDDGDELEPVSVMRARKPRT